MGTTRYASIVMDNARWEHVPVRDDDIIVSTPPKCGTTWVQTCCAMLVHGTTDLPRPLSELSPWVDMLTWPLDELVETVERQTHRRVLKTHTPLDGLPWNRSATYLCVGRDPRDVALSWDNHMASMDLGNFLSARLAAVGTEGIDMENLPAPPPADPVDRFWQWIEMDPAEDGEPMIGLVNLVHHVRGFWERRDQPNVHLLHYADLKADLPGQVRRLAGALGVQLDDATLDAIAQAATFEQMKARADILAPDTTHKIWQDNARFFDKARSGGWRDIEGADSARYHDRVQSLASQELVDWLHR